MIVGGDGRDVVVEEERSRSYCLQAKSGAVEVEDAVKGGAEEGERTTRGRGGRREEEGFGREEGKDGRRAGWG